MGTKQEIEKMKLIVGAMITLGKDLDDTYRSSQLSFKHSSLDDKIKKVSIGLISLEMALSKILRQEYKS